MSWQRGPRTFADPYTVSLAVVRNAIAASADPIVTGTVAVRRMPPARPAKVVQLRRDGGAAVVDALVDAVLLTYRVWHPDDPEALASFVRGALLNAPQIAGGAQVKRVEDVMAPIDVPDPDDDTVTTYFGRVELWTRL